MKTALVFSLFYLVITVSATQWEDVENPRNSLKYSGIVDKLMAESQVFENQITGRITNGSPARLGDFPYQVFVLQFRSVGAAYMCGGSLIHRKWVLSAAHCFVDVVKVEVNLGTVNMAGPHIKTITITRSRSIIMHPQYNTITKNADIALLELPEDAPIDNNFISLINLPKGSDLTRNLVGTQATVSGFGRSSDSPSDNNLVLNSVTLPIISNTVCAAAFGSDRVNNGHICLESSNRQSACSGDSGGPLTIIGNGGQKIQVGTVQYGDGNGCENNSPQVYARVSSYIPWIEATTGINFSS